MKRVLFTVFALLLWNQAFAAITLRGTQGGPNPNGGNVTQTLPAGVANNDLVLVGLVGAGTTGTRYITGNNHFTAPAGWTQACQGANFAIFYHLWQTGDPTSVTFTSNLGSWETSAAIAYIGVDTTNPVDQAACTITGEQPGSFFATDGTVLLPSTSPAWSGDQLVGFVMQTNSLGTTLNLPAALTSRVSSNPGPGVAIGDKALSSTSNTGDMNGLVGTITGFGGQVLLKASGASSAPFQQMPVVAAYIHAENASGTNTLDFADYAIQSGDMAVVYWPQPTNSGGATISAVTSGYTLAFSSNNAALAYGIYTSGSTTFTWTGGNNEIVVYLLRNTRGTLPINFDTSSTNSATAATSISTSSVTVALPNNSLMLTGFLNTDTTTGTFTIGTGQAKLSTGSKNSTNIVNGVVDNPPNPSGTFSATYSTTGNLYAVASVWKCAAASGIRHRSGIY